MAEDEVASAIGLDRDIYSDSDTSDFNSEGMYSDEDDDMDDDEDDEDVS
jgi:hypothetical protein